MIYLAVPYSSDDPAVSEERFKIANLVAGKLIERGLIVYSPLSHSVPIAKVCEEIGYPEWLRHCVEMVKRSSMMIVLKVPGWDTSVGVSTEINHANANYVPVVYMEEKEVLRLCKKWRDGLGV